MRTKRRLGASILAFTMTAFFLMISLRAWFSEGDIARMFITTGLSDCEVELFAIDDFNCDGIYDGNYTFEDFTYIITEEEVNGYVGTIGTKDIIISQDPVDSELYTLKDSANENEIFMRHIENSEEEAANILFEHMYPSKTVSFAFSIRSGNPLNVGHVTFMLDIHSGGNGLGNVLTLNFAGESIFLYGDNSNLKSVADPAVGDLINLDSETIVLEDTDVIWVFFSFKFPTIEEIKQMADIDLSLGITNELITSLFMNNTIDPFSDHGTPYNYNLPKFHINYELTDVKKIT